MEWGNENRAIHQPSLLDISGSAKSMATKCENECLYLSDLYTQNNLKPAAYTLRIAIPTKYF